ncbi:xanthine permease [Methanoplanus sp. FWC-SCC4]|uniref:Xanthine permease n=1 Tax=Methanochimaera problematica TaxID=2609417 RepID=A0AA97I596_9EURY|nr:solute carrier family 23 protein [Methanoplanus sp. FWC-SCC4]WOF17221.1 xanthine permease [Methanoplanus sp. FWC-SCC4]
MDFIYGPEEKPPLGYSLSSGMQWAAVLISYVIILGVVVSTLHYSTPSEEVYYIQKLLLVTAFAVVLQVIAGHRLPVIFGPATVLLIGILSSQAFSTDAIYSSILIGGILGVIAGSTGLLIHISRLFTERVVTVVLLLVVFTMIPTITDLLTGVNSGTGAGPLESFIFSLILIMSIFAANRFLKGFFQTTLLLWVIVFGTIIYALIFPFEFTLVSGLPDTGILTGFTKAIVIEPGVLISFIICYFALLINDIGSIKGIGEVLGDTNMEGRFRRGVVATGVVNIISGISGVIGGVNYSTSAGIILDSKCASKWTLIPAAGFLVVAGLVPQITSLMAQIPTPVIGCLLIYVMAAMFSASMHVFFKSENKPVFDFDSGIIVGLPVILGAITSTIPHEITASFPGILQPVISNGFVIGVIAVILMEHLIYSKKGDKN